MSANPYAPPVARVDDIAAPEQSGTPLFFAVSLTKFVVLSICTLGLYELYWFYRNWRLIKVREGVSMVPALRAFFAVFFCYALFARVRDRAAQREIGPTLAAGPLAAGWIITTVAARLPDPYWLIAFVAFVFLIPVQARVNRLNAEVAPGHDRNARFDVWDWLVVAPGALLFLAMLVGVFVPEPK
jgi:hypothetical protein